MADALSPEEMVSMFCSVTNLSTEEAEQRLQAFDWSLEAAVNSALADAGGGSPPPPPPPPPAPPAGSAADAGTQRGGRGAMYDDDEPAGLVDDDDDDEGDGEDEDYDDEDEGGDRRGAGGGARAGGGAGAEGVPPTQRLLARLRSALGFLLLPVVRTVLLPLYRLLAPAIGFVGELLIVSPLRLLLGWGPGGGGGGAGGRVRAPTAGPRDREALNAIAAAEAHTFKERFEGRHGPDHPDFFIGSLQQAIDAAKVSLRFVLVYVHCESDNPSDPSLPACDDFCANVLCSELFRAVVAEHFVIWVSDTASRDGRHVARQLGLRDAPALAVVAYGALLQGAESSELRVLERLGPQRCVRADGVIAHLVAVVERHEAMVVAARAEREERERTRLLVEEQHAEFNAALAADQARERREEEERLREEAERRAREEAERAAAEEERQLEAEASARATARQRKAESLPPEPESGSPDICRLAVRLPDGRRLDRRWAKDTPLQLVVDWVEAAAADEYDVALVSHFPRREFAAAELAKSLEQLGLCPQAVLYVKEKDTTAGSEEGENDSVRDMDSVHSRRGRGGGAVGLAEGKDGPAP